MKKILLLSLLFFVKFYGQSSWQGVANPIGASITPSSTKPKYNKNAVVGYGLNDTPVIAYIDQNNKIAVKAFYNGTGWITIGNAANITTNNVTNIDLEIHPVTKEVFIVYSDGGSSPANRPIVKKYNGSGWDTVGGGYVATTASIINDIEFDKNNVLTIAYLANPGSLNVKRYDTAWNIIGYGDIGTATTQVASARVDLDFNASNQPYVLYWDTVGISNAPGHYLTKFNGTTWEYIGNSRVNPSSSGSDYRLAVVGDIPWLSYAEGTAVKILNYNGGWNVIPTAASVSGDGNDHVEIESYGTNLYVGYQQIFYPVSSVSYALKTYDTVNGTWAGTVIGNSFIYNNPTTDRILHNTPSFALSSTNMPMVVYASGTNTAMAYYYGPTNFLSVEDFNASGLSMFPNPVLDHVSIANNNNVQISAYAVVDLNGRTLVTKKYDANSNLIDLTNLKKGIYFIQLQTEKGTLSKKISKD